MVFVFLHCFCLLKFVLFYFLFRLYTTLYASLHSHFYTFCSNCLHDVDAESCKNKTKLKVITLNTWGMPAAFGSKDKELRIDNIAKYIRKKMYDVYMLQELWMRSDHNSIKNLLPVGKNSVTKLIMFIPLNAGYKITAYDQLTSRFCDGRITLFMCSGLAIVSKYSFIEVK